MQYYGSYRLTSATEIAAKGSDEVQAQSYQDVYARWTLPAFSSYVDGTQITFGIKNLLNDYTMEGTGLSSYSNPRLRQYYLSAKFNF